jgi:hypothetical protein
MELRGLASDPNELWKYLQNTNIKDLPKELQDVANKIDLKQGDKDKIDSPDELKKLMQQIVGQDGQSLPNNPGVEAVGGMSPEDLKQLLIDWVMNKSGQENKPQAAAPMGGRDLGHVQPSGGTGSGSGGGSGGGGMTGGGGTGGAKGPSGAAPTSGGPPNTKPSGDVKQWVDQAAAELEKEGIHLTDADKQALYARINQESGGDPNAINNWDSNAAKGTPSKGILQTIDSTFNSFKSPGHDDIWNPVDNIMAAVKYMYDRYGGPQNLPSGGY